VTTEFEVSLLGPKGEPVDLFRTFMSHGVADLPSNVDERRRTYTTTLALPRTRPRTIRISEGRPGFARVEAEGRRLGQWEADDLTTAVRRILNVDEDLSDFYALVADDPDPVKTKRTLIRTWARTGEPYATSATYRRFCKCTSSGSSS
jgi:hypothetical protein